MPSLEELRSRIGATKDLQSVVRVMKSLSAVSIGQYQAASRSLRRYQDVVDRSLQVTLGDAHLLGREDNDEARCAIVAMGSDRGLCGRFNERVAEKVSELARLRDTASEPTPMVVIGTRLAARLEAAGLEPYQIFAQPGSVDGIARTVETVLAVVDELQQDRAITRTDIAYSCEADDGGIQVASEVLFPLDQALLRRIADRPWPTNKLPMISGPPGNVRSTLIRERLFVTLLRTGAESLAAEHAARLSAMQAAERNINEKLDELETAFRRERQDAITTELLDIVSAYKSLAESSRDDGTSD